MTLDKNDILKRAVLFAGCSVFAVLVSVLLHELGHALAVYLSDGQLARISIHPLRGGVTRYWEMSHEAANNHWITAGGMTGGFTAGILMTVVFLRTSANPWTAPLLMTGVASAGGNGLMLTVGAVTAQVGDVSKLTAMGVPAAFLFALGCAMMAAGMYYFMRVLPFLGFGPEDPISSRVAVTVGGLLPFALAVLGFNIIYPHGSFQQYLIYVAVGLSLALAAALVSGYLHPRLAAFGEPARAISWGHAAFSVMLGVGAVAGCMFSS